MRNLLFLKNEYYLVKNFGSFGANIFIDEMDKARFLFLILYLQSPTIINNVDWYVLNFIKKGDFRINNKTTKEIIDSRQVELVSFNIQESEFTIILHCLEDFIISVYMQRVLTGYSRYFNSKYNKKGHVFQGPFQAEKIKKSDLLNMISSNHKLIDGEQNKYSSIEDYAGGGKKNRWRNLIKIYSKK